MRVLIHPRTITADQALRERVVLALTAALGPVEARLQWVDVYLTDVNGPRGGPDKRCRVVAHLPGGRPVVVSRMERDPVSAVAMAASRCRRSVRNRLKRRQHRRRMAAAR
jgi:hypothetical protein